MKKVIIILSVTSFVCGNISAQDIKESDVPTAVVSAFKKQYPNVKEVEWEKEGDNYEAEIELVQVPMDGKGKKREVEKSLEYTATGELVKTEEQIEIKALPAAINDYVNKNYPGKKIKEASKITEANGTIKYEAEVEKQDLIFDANGAFLEKEATKDDDDKKKN
ncbi:MAG: PepSY-like domain-containing protein [Bacteroidetes bacterium]|nr:PepSY-like domain-containing protein [Bacteroidota bacterium]